MVMGYRSKNVFIHVGINMFAKCKNESVRRKALCVKGSLIITDHQMEDVDGGLSTNPEKERIEINSLLL